MVAAWIRRAHRRRSGHGVGQPDKERNLRRLSGGADKEEQSDNVILTGLNSSTCFCSSMKSNVQMPWRPKLRNQKRKCPSIKPKSPMRLTMNALLPAMVLS